MITPSGLPLCLTPEELLAGLQTDPAEPPIAGASWYLAQAEGAGFACRFPAGALAGARYLTADMLLDGEHLAVFLLTLQEGDNGPQFGMLYGALNQCSARVRVPLAAVNQNTWRFEREGAWLKPVCCAQRVDLERVDRLTLTVARKSERPVRWCQTAFSATAQPPPPLSEPLLPRGPLLDALGQNRLQQWSGKSHSHSQVTARLHRQLQTSGEAHWPAGFSRWGGWTARIFDASGYFRTLHDGRRWWLVDPDGCIFWSSGLDCVRVGTGAAHKGLEKALAWLPDPAGPYKEAYAPRSGQEEVSYLAANLIRAFGPQAWRQSWAQITLAELRRWGFNTIGNWSDWQIARAAGFPYVRPLEPHFPHTPLAYRDFPDVYDPAFAADAAAYAEPLRETAADPALIGYFLMNEPAWSLTLETPAAGMLLNSEGGACRAALAAFLKRRYANEGALAIAWGPEASLAALREGVWHAPLSEAAQKDLVAFSGRMVEKLFQGLSAACRAVDPHHLNLGVRYYTIPPTWALQGMRAFDVFSMNCYEEQVPCSDLAGVSAYLQRPVLIGEWHFGALDVGLPGSGIGHVRNQIARGQAFRVYLEHAAANPACIGAHYFTLYDQSALGRFDGENYNIGFLDVCHRPYHPLCRAARSSHEQLYPLAMGEGRPYDEAPEYLPKLFL